MGMGEVFSDDSILDIMMERLTDEFLKAKYGAETDDDITLHQAVITVCNMYANRAMRNGPWRKEKRRESDMVVTSTPSAVLTAKIQAIDSKIALIARERCRGKHLLPTHRKKSWCSLHNTDLHEITTVGPKCGTTTQPVHNSKCSAHANTVTTPSSTTQIENYVPMTHTPSTTAAATKSATSASFAAPPCPSSPPVG